MQQNQAITPAQNTLAMIKQSQGFDAFVKLFELSGNEPEIAAALAEKEAYHLSVMMQDNPDLKAIPPAALVMELRKIPLQGVTLDPSLKLANLYISDKAAGKVTLEVTGRGKAVQAIAQNIIRDVDTTVIFEGDEIVRENGINVVIPKFKAGAKVVGGFITIVWGDGRITQDAYNSSHIASWMGRSARRFRQASQNYSSFNGGIEPGFMQSKMLKHKLDRIGINPMPGAYRHINAEKIKAIPEDIQDDGYGTGGQDAEVIDDTTRQEFYPDQPAQDTPANWVL